MQFPAPDLVVEVLSPKTAKTERTTKYVDYEAHGAGEYWIVDPKKREVEQYVLNEGKYEVLFKGKTGVIKSQIVDGFVIEAAAIFDNKLMNQTIDEWYF